MTRLVALSVGTVLVILAPAAASAATLDADRSCYFNNKLADLSGSGFAPDSPIVFTVNGERIDQSITSDSAGEVFVRYDPPPTRRERKLVIEATDSEDTSARTTIRATARRRVTARPDHADDVRTWKAVIQLFGFGRGSAFIHYINPKDNHKKTVRLGRLRGPCGRLKTDERRVMPFPNPQFGTWHLQFDVRRRYDPDRKRKQVVPVEVFRG